MTQHNSACGRAIRNGGDCSPAHDGVVTRVRLPDPRRLAERLRKRHRDSVYHLDPRDREMLLQAAGLIEALADVIDLTGLEA